MALALGVPASQLSQDDIALTGRAARRQYPVDHATLGVMQFRKLGVKPRHLLPLVDAFIDLDTPKRGCISPEDAILGRKGELPAAPALLCLVRAFADSQGLLDMHAWLLLHLLLGGRAPGGWSATAAALQEAAAQAGTLSSSAEEDTDAFLHALEEAMGAARGTAAPGCAADGLERLPGWLEHQQAPWKAIMAQWVPSTEAMDAIWAE